MLKTKYYSIRVVEATSFNDAIEKVQNQEFIDEDALCDSILDLNQLMQQLERREDIEDQFFKIDGYWKNDCGQFVGNVVCSKEFDEDKHGEIDDQIFFYGLSESDIKYAIEHVRDTDYEFVITSYEKI